MTEWGTNESDRGELVAIVLMVGMIVFVFLAVLALFFGFFLVLLLGWP